RLLQRLVQPPQVVERQPQHGGRGGTTTAAAPAGRPQRIELSPDLVDLADQSAGLALQRFELPTDRSSEPLSAPSPRADGGLLRCGQRAPGALKLRGDLR